MRETEGVEGERAREREMRDNVRNRRWRESMRGKPGERLKRQQNKGESKREEAETEYCWVGVGGGGRAWLGSTEEEMRGIESTFVCLFSPAPWSSSISPH